MSSGFAPGSTRARGDKTESLVVAELARRGLVLVERNATQAGSEVDLIAKSKDDATYVFVEVRGRKSDEHGRPIETVDARKRSQIIRATTAWLVGKGLWERVAVRFDVVGVTLGEDGSAPDIEWVENAFEAG